MRYIRYFLLIALALLLQSTFVGRFDLYGVRPDLALIVLVMIASEARAVEIIYIAFCIGFIQDVYSPEYLGYNAFSMSVTALFIGMIKERLTVENYSVKLMTTFLACIVHGAFYMSFYTSFELSNLITLFVSESLPGAVFTSVLAVSIVKAWQWAQTGGLFVVLRELMGDRR